MQKSGGRPRSARKLYDDTNNKVEAICKTLGVSKPTLYAYLYNRHKSGKED